MAVLAFLPALKDGVSREVPDDCHALPVLDQQLLNIFPGLKAGDFQEGH